MIILMSIIMIIIIFVFFNSFLLVMTDDFIVTDKISKLVCFNYQKTEICEKNRDK